MAATHELLGRDVDPIDDVRHQLEAFYTENYFNPFNGDWISDDYRRIIDLSTQPGKLNGDETGKLNRSISRLNGKYSHIERLLGESSLVTAYKDVAQQVNAINAADPSRHDIAHFETIAVEAPAVRS